MFLVAGILALIWLYHTPEGLLGKADAVGYAVCHRIDARSFHLGDRPLPLCARCSGMYLGAVLGLAYQAIRAPRQAGLPSRPILFLLGLLAMAFAIDGLNSYMTIFLEEPVIYQPNNTLRLVTGTGLGIAMAAILYPTFNQTVWKVQDRRPALGKLPTFGILLALGLALDLVVLAEIPAILYPLALISAAGVFAILAPVYSLVWLFVFRLENRYSSLSGYTLPLAGGFIVALLQVGLFDLVRFFLTGTWDGFHLG